MISKIQTQLEKSHWTLIDNKITFFKKKSSIF